MERSERIEMKLILSALLLFTAPTKDPACICIPTPHIHVDTSDGGFNASATCPEGWEVHISKKAADEYNHVRTEAAVINMLADASCVRVKGLK